MNAHTNKQYRPFHLSHVNRSIFIRFCTHLVTCINSPLCSFPKSVCRWSFWAVLHGFWFIFWKRYPIWHRKIYIKYKYIKQHSSEKNLFFSFSSSLRLFCYQKKNKQTLISTHIILWFFNNCFPHILYINHQNSFENYLILKDSISVNIVHTNNRYSYVINTRI